MEGDWGVGQNSLLVVVWIEQIDGFFSLLFERHMIVKNCGRNYYCDAID